MPWNKHSDTAATYPAAMRVASVPGADDRSVNEAVGFVYRLSALSSAHLTDYVVDAGTVAMIGGANTAQLLKLCTRVGLLTRTKDSFGMIAYRIIDDPEFIHIRSRAEIEWERQQRADTADIRLTAPVRLRDGDQCRYCGVLVQWMGRTSARKATFDHLEPGSPATVETLVVACKSCNSSLRDTETDERRELRPIPAEPFYRPSTAEWLTKNGHPVKATEAADKRPGSRPDTAPAKRTPRAPRQRPGSRPDTASNPSNVSDPAPSGHRAAGGDIGGTHPPPRKPSASRDPQDIESSSAGSGRVGSGFDSGSSSEINAARRRRRSPRGRGTRGTDTT